MVMWKQWGLRRATSEIDVALKRTHASHSGKYKAKYSAAQFNTNFHLHVKQSILFYEIVKDLTLASKQRVNTLLNAFWVLRA